MTFTALSTPDGEDKNTVKPSLTTTRKAKHAIDSKEYAAMVRRVINGLAKRIANGDIDALPYLVELEPLVAVAIQSAVDAMREEPYRYTWREIGERLGMTRQNAHLRWGATETRPLGATPQSPLAQDPLPCFTSDAHKEEL